MKGVDRGDRERRGGNAAGYAFHIDTIWKATNERILAETIALESNSSCAVRVRFCLPACRVVSQLSGACVSERFVVAFALPLLHCGQFSDGLRESPKVSIKPEGVHIQSKIELLKKAPPLVSKRRGELLATSYFRTT